MLKERFELCQRLPYLPDHDADISAINRKIFRKGGLFSKFSKAATSGVEEGPVLEVFFLYCRQNAEKRKIREYAAARKLGGRASNSRESVPKNLMAFLLRIFIGFADAVV